jgi:hypothetical protein
MLGKILGSAIGGAVAGLFKAMFGWFTNRQTRADQVELGQQRQANAQHEVAAEATKRMEKAQAGPRGRDVTQKDLDHGSF